MYVDDAKNPEDAYKLYEKSRSRLMQERFKLRKFTSNSSELTSRIRFEEINETTPTTTCPNTIPDDICYAKSMFESERSYSNQEQQILGVLWNTDTDEILLDFKHITQQAQQLQPTKRNMAHLVAKMYDLFGFVSPVTAKLKIFFQSLCKSDVFWDQVLTNELLQCWKEVIAGFSSAGPVTIDRCYLTTESNIIRYSLRGFCDALSKVYATVIYLLIETDCGGLIKFVDAKSRVAPLST